MKTIIKADTEPDVKKYLKFALDVFDSLNSKKIKDLPNAEYIGVIGLFAAENYAHYRKWLNALKEYEDGQFWLTKQYRTHDSHISDIDGDVTRAIEANIDHYLSSFLHYINLIKPFYN